MNYKPTVEELLVLVDSLRKENDMLRRDIGLSQLLSFRQLFNEMSSAFALHRMIYDAGGNPADYEFIEVNKAFEKFTRLKSDDIIGKTVMTVMPKTEKYWIDRFGKVAITGIPIEFVDYSSELKRYYDVKAFSPAKDHFAVTFHDVTTRIEMEKELQEKNEEIAITNEKITQQNEKLKQNNDDLIALNLSLMQSEERLENVIAHSNEMHYIHGTDHVLTYVSPQCKAMFGYSPNEMLLRWTSLATDNPVNLQGFELTVKAITTGVKQEKYQLELKRKDNSIFWVEVTESPLRDKSGKVIGIVGSLSNITAQKQAEANLRDTIEKLKIALKNQEKP